MEKIEVVKMKESMLEECVDLFIATFSREPWNDVYESTDQVRTFFRNHFANNYFLGYVILIDDKIEGLSLGMKKPWIQGLEYYIDEYCINHELQGKGLGSLFIKEIEVDIKRNGLNGIILNTEKGLPSYKFYSNNGFKEIEGLVILAK